MNTFIQFDNETKRVTAVIYSDSVTVDDFIMLEKELPKPEPGKEALFYNEADNVCYFATEPPNDSQRIEMMEQENEDLKSRLAFLEDALMILTMPGL